MKIGDYDVPTAFPLFGDVARKVESALDVVNDAANEGLDNKAFRSVLGGFVHDYFAIMGVPSSVAEEVTDKQAAALYTAVQNPFAG